MRAAGVQTVRVAFYWDQMQPYPSFDQVPPERAHLFENVNGVPTAFGFTDGVVAAAQAAGLRVMPVVLRTPSWATHNPLIPGSPPSETGRLALKDYLKAMIHRYKPGGAIHMWQVFNEPNMLYAWRTNNPIGQYVRLLRAVYPAIKRADRHAKVVAAGMSAYSARALERVYAAGGRKFFDIAAIHPFRLTVAASMRVVRKAREVMDEHGDSRKPLLLSELSWTSAWGRMPHPSAISTTEMGQAKRVFKALRVFAGHRRALRIAGVFWSTWASRETNETDAFDWAGLRRVTSDGTVVDKPALLAFRAAARRISR